MIKYLSEQVAYGSIIIFAVCDTAFYAGSQGFTEKNAAFMKSLGAGSDSCPITPGE